MHYTRLKDLREDSDLKQSELCEKINISKNTYVNYEQGKREPPFELIIKLAKFYEVSIDYISGKTNNKKGIYQSDLSEREQKLISMFREMTREEQGRLLERAEIIIEDNEGNTENKDVG